MLGDSLAGRTGGHLKLWFQGNGRLAYCQLLGCLTGESFQGFHRFIVDCQCLESNRGSSSFHLCGLQGCSLVLQPQAGRGGCTQSLEQLCLQRLQTGTQWPPSEGQRWGTRRDLSGSFEGMLMKKREVALITRGEWVKRKPFPNLMRSESCPWNESCVTGAGEERGGLGEQNQRRTFCDVLLKGPLPWAVRNF